MIKENLPSAKSGVYTELELVKLGQAMLCSKAKEGIQQMKFNFAMRPLGHVKQGKAVAGQSDGDRFSDFLQYNHRVVVEVMKLYLKSKYVALPFICFRCLHQRCFSA